MSNRRRHTRKHTDLSVTFVEGEGSRTAGQCHNMSLGGAYISTASPPAMDANIAIFIRFPGRSTEQRFGSTVRWTQPAGIGVQFGALGAQATYELTEYLATCTALEDTD